MRSWTLCVLFISLLFLTLVSFGKEASHHGNFVGSKTLNLVKRQPMNYESLNSEPKLRHSNKIQSYLQLKYPARVLLDESENEPHQNGAETLMMRDIDFSGFTSVVYVGTPKQELYCIFDTGSSVMFVNSYLCDQDNCFTNPQYDPEKSEDSNIPSPEHDISLVYGGGYLDGIVIQDTVWINNMKVPNQDIAEVTDQDDESTPNFSCLIGLSFPDLAPNGEKLLFDNMMENELLEDNIFTTYYYKDGSHGEITFGEINQKYYTGDIIYHPVRIKHHWNIRIDDVKVGGRPLNLWPNGCQGLVDTGTNLNTFERKQYAAVKQAIGSQLDCQNPGALPSLTYVIGGVDYTLTGKEYVTAAESGHRDCELGFFAMQVTADPDSPAMLLGVLFLQKYFAVFDRDFDQIGFALATDLVVDPAAAAQVDAIEELS